MKPIKRYFPYLDAFIALNRLVRVHASDIHIADSTIRNFNYSRMFSLANSWLSTFTKKHYLFLVLSTSFGYFGSILDIPDYYVNQCIIELLVVFCTFSLQLFDFGLFRNINPHFQ